MSLCAWLGVALTLGFIGGTVLAAWLCGDL
jgi:hypothetical protein